MKGVLSTVGCDLKDPNLSDIAGLHGATGKTGVGQLFRMRFVIDTTGMSDGGTGVTTQTFWTLPTTDFVLLHAHFHLLNNFTVTGAGGTGVPSFSMGIPGVGQIVSAPASAAMSGGAYNASGSHKVYWIMSQSPGSLLDGTLPGGASNTDWAGNSGNFLAVGPSILGQPLGFTISLSANYTVTQGQFRIQLIGAFLL